MIIKSLLDTDMYKFTMQQAVFHQFPQATTGWRFVCRNKDVNLSHLVEEVNEELDQLVKLRFQPEELRYLRQLGYFKDDYLDYLKTFKLNRDQVTVGVKNDQLSIEVKPTAPWVECMLFEIYCLSIVNELYFRPQQTLTNYSEGLRRLQEKIKLCLEYHETVSELVKDDSRWLFKFLEFGTRRRFSREWQELVLVELKRALGLHLAGTSNVYLAMKLGLNCRGTMAHEWQQAHQVLAPELIHFQRTSVDNWTKEYGDVLQVSLTDVMSTESFLADLSQHHAEKFNFRHDSGNPYAWAKDKILPFYKLHSVDPKKKTLLYSDGLSMSKSIDLHRFTVNQIESSALACMGTSLTNDMGVTPLNIVMKMTSCNGQPVMKCSDEPSKTICDDKELIVRMKRMFNISG